MTEQGGDSWIVEARLEAGAFILWAVVFGVGVFLGGMLAASLPVVAVLVIGLLLAVRQGHHHLVAFTLGLVSLGSCAEIAIATIWATLPLLLVSHLFKRSQRPVLLLFILTLLFQLPLLFMPDELEMLGYGPGLEIITLLEPQFLLWSYWLVGLVHLDIEIKESLLISIDSVSNDCPSALKMNRKLILCIIPSLVLSAFLWDWPDSLNKFALSLLVFVPLLSIPRRLALLRIPLGDIGRVTLGLLVFVTFLGGDRLVVGSSILITLVLAPALCRASKVNRRAALGLLIVGWSLMSYLFWYTNFREFLVGQFVLTIVITAWVNLTVLHSLKTGGSRILAVWVSFLLCLQEPWRKLVVIFDGKGPNFDE
jgi:hypothetical protein